MTVETTRRVYRVERSQIGFIKFILEAYDNVAVLSTLDPRLALVQVVVAPGCETMVDGIMADLGVDAQAVLVADAGADGDADDNYR